MTKTTYHWLFRTVLLAGAFPLAYACGSDSGSSNTGGTGSGGAGSGDASVGSGATGGGGSALGASGVSCTAASDCTAPWPYCDDTLAECVQCQSTADCGGRQCDATTRLCAAPAGAGGGSGSGVTGSAGPTGGPRFPGAGSVAGVPLQPGFGPETADDCPGASGSGTAGTQQLRDTATLCFYGQGETTPSAAIEQVIEAVDDQEYIHLRVTFDPRFADNTYGEGSVGWGGRDGIRDFSKLVGSDHLELLLTDCSGETVMQFKLDYIGVDPDSPSGYGSLGVTDKDGEMIVGDPASILAATTSLDRNLNGCGYSDYLDSSPTTSENLEANPDTPAWDYRVVYEVWVDAAAFEQCFGQAYIERVHASPAKWSSDTIEVEGDPCPPEWNTPYCPEGTSAALCDVPPDAGAPCPSNWTTYAACTSECVPIPFAGYTNRAACPDGYTLDLATEGQYCVPVTGSVCP